MPTSPTPTSDVVLDLTDRRSKSSDPEEPNQAKPDEEEPASELAARWRDLRASRR